MHVTDPFGNGADFEFLVACFVQSLINGNNIKHSTIRAKTVKGYLEAVNELYTLSQCRPPYRPQEKRNIPAHLVKLLNKWESMPYRREPISPEMTAYMEQIAQGSDQDGIVSATWDWFVLSRYTGFRIGEFAQRSQYRADYHVAGGGKRILKAFNSTDFVFSDQTRKVIAPSRLDTDPESIEQVTIRWRIQKNRRNGEKINLFRDDKNPSLCPVRAAHRVILRAQRCGMTSEDPIGVYRTEKRQVRFLVGADFAKLFRRAAIQVHALTHPDDINRYSAHSMRVTAAVLLHQADKPASYIKIRLRWASDTFMMYLRNTVVQAKQHVAAINGSTDQAELIQLNTINCPDTVTYTVPVDAHAPKLRTHRDVCI